MFGDYDDKAISKLIADEEYDEAITLIRAGLKTYPKDDWHSHWLWACLSTCYYEKFQYRRAAQYAYKAANFAPNCPLSLWYYATANDMVGRRNGDKGALEVAEQTFRGILSFGWRYMAFVDPCGEGEKWAKAMLNDCRYRLALIAFHKGNIKEAIRWGKLHLRMRRPGQKSIYKKQRVLKDLRTWENGPQ